MSRDFARCDMIKLYRKPIPRMYSYRYRLYLNRRDIRQKLHLLRQIRGRKFVSGPEGASHNLEDLFERLNHQYFDGLLGRPLELFIEDTASNESVAVGNVRKLIQRDKVDMVLGGITSSSESIMDSRRGPSSSGGTLNVEYRSSRSGSPRNSKISLSPRLTR